MHGVLGPCRILTSPTLPLENPLSAGPAPPAVAIRCASPWRGRRSTSPTWTNASTDVTAARKPSTWWCGRNRSRPPQLAASSGSIIFRMPAGRHAGLRDSLMRSQRSSRTTQRPCRCTSRTTTCAGSTRPRGPRQRSPWASLIACGRLATC